MIAIAPRLRFSQNGGMDMQEVKAELKRRGLKSADLARFIGITPDKLSKTLNGGRQPRYDEVPKIQEFLRSAGELKGAGLLGHKQLMTERIPPDEIPIFGTGETSEDGTQPFNSGEVIETVGRPHNLIGVNKAYGLYVYGHSMEPRYQQGERVFVHPGKPTSPGSFVVVELHPKEEGGSRRALIKKLVRVTANKIVLEQFHPPKTFEVPAREVIAIHRIVATEV